MSEDDYCDGAIRYLSYEDLIDLNQLCAELTPDEPVGVLKPEQLSSSQDCPAKVRYYNQTNDIARLAAALMWSLIRNHPFHSANKRTAFLAAMVFMRINGHSLHVPLRDGLEMAELLAIHERSQLQLAQWLADNSSRSDAKTLGKPKGRTCKLPPGIPWL